MKNRSPDFFSKPARIGFQIPDFEKLDKDILFPGSSTRKLRGKELANELILQCATLSKKHPLRPHLAVVLAGEDPASHVYVANKEKAFAKAGFSTETFRIPSAEVTQSRLIQLIETLNAKPDVHGILVQLPLPSGISSSNVLSAISPSKDVDGFLKENMGALALGEFSGALPCTPFGVMVLLASYGISVEGKNAVVVGRSNIVGKPAALLLLSCGATVTVCHSRTVDLPSVTKTADILVVAAGKKGLIGKEHVKAGAVVIDVGVHRNPDNTLCGDCRVEELIGHASALTPVPGGVGPMTIAMLLVNTASAAWSE
jgi:methylenetetrahydrofolate dehydrogenase (NADP+) / methenyltetrahydrofolate cyclohydrolase